MTASISPKVDDPSFRRITFDQLREEGGRMMSVGLHGRIAGRPGRARAVARFLDHVLPDGFTKIRHYGLYAGSHVNGRLIAARALIGATQDAGPTALSSDDEPEAERRVDIPTLLFGEEFLKCPVCKVGRMQRVALIPVSPPVRGPP